MEGEALSANNFSREKFKEWEEKREGKPSEYERNGKWVVVVGVGMSVCRREKEVCGRGDTEIGKNCHNPFWFQTNCFHHSTGATAKYNFCVENLFKPTRI